MATPEELERRYTLPAAVARYDALRIRDALAPPPGEDPHPGPSPAPLARTEALELLALGEVIARRAACGRQLSVRSARRAGASWTQIGEALGTSKQAAWEAHTRWTDAQSAARHRDAGHWGPKGGEIEAARVLAGETEGEQ